MPTEMINIKLDSKFLKEIDEVVEKGNYHSRTEFIRESLRSNLEEHNMRKLKEHYAQLRSKFGKKNISQEQYEAARKLAVEEIEKASK